jgi:hypothetical protein
MSLVKSRIIREFVMSISITITIRHAQVHQRSSKHRDLNYFFIKLKVKIECLADRKKSVYSAFCTDELTPQLSDGLSSRPADCIRVTPDESQ